MTVDLPKVTTSISAPKSRPNQLQTRIPSLIRDCLDLDQDSDLEWSLAEKDGVDGVFIRKVDSRKKRIQEYRKKRLHLQ